MAEKRRILLIEDEPSIVKLVSTRLQTAGFDVTVATNGWDGLAKAREGQAELIILDVILPKLNGYEICTLLKRDTKYEHIPIIILSAKSQEGDEHEGITCGADAYVSKPFKHEVLLDLINMLLAKQPPAQEALGSSG